MRPSKAGTEQLSGSPASGPGSNAEEQLEGQQLNICRLPVANTAHGQSPWGQSPWGLPRVSDEQPPSQVWRGVPSAPSSSFRTAPTPSGDLRGSPGSEGNRGPAPGNSGLEGQESCPGIPDPASLEGSLPPASHCFAQLHPSSLIPLLLVVPATWTTFPCLFLLCESWPVLPGFFLWTSHRLSLKVCTEGLPSGDYNWPRIFH